MTRQTKDEPFDCIAFKRRVQSEIYERIKGMTHEEEIEYFRRAVEDGPFAELVSVLRAREKQGAGRGSTGRLSR